MGSIGYVGKMLSDGHLSLPDEVVRRLGLRIGQDIDITVHVAGEDEPLPDHAYEPLLRLIGLVEAGRVDAAARHDEYLYKEDPA